MLAADVGVHRATAITHLSNMYSLSHINWCRLCIRVSAKKSRGKNLIGALEVSYRPTDTKFFPLSAKNKRRIRLICVYFEELINGMLSL